MGITFLKPKLTQNLICKGVNGCTPVAPYDDNVINKHNQLADNVIAIDMSIKIMRD
jgi:hypothetical protein